MASLAFNAFDTRRLHLTNDEILNMKTIKLATAVLLLAGSSTAMAFVTTLDYPTLSASDFAQISVAPFIGTGATDGPNEAIFFNADGSISTYINQNFSTYDGIEDAYVAVVNNTSSSIASFSLTGPSIYGFDGDGINGYISQANNAMDTTGYGGPTAYFNIVDINTGTVNFIGGLAGNGGSTYFSLEEPANLAQGAVTNPVGVPEANTFAMLGLGLLGMSFMRKNAKKI